MTDVLLILVLIVGIADLLVGLIGVGMKQTAAPPGLTGGQRDSLAYVYKLLGNYHAAHATSPLTGVEIEEVLRLCQEKVEEVLGS